MRHDKAQKLLELARLLSSTAEGLSLDEMASQMAVGRRTAERMRDALFQLYPQIEEFTEGSIKRFRLPRGLDTSALVPTKDELLELTKAAKSLRTQGYTYRAAALETLELKVKSAMKRPLLTKFGPDIATLAQTEVSAARVGPKPHEDPHTISTIRHSILAMRTLSFRYQGGSRPGFSRLVTPCGLLFDRWNYLIGIDHRSSEVRTWRLDRLQDLQILEAPAVPPAGFSLENYVKQSFGIYQDDVETVVLKILPHGADEARAWVFHAGQQLEEQDDGSILVRFQASGMLELAWHLFTWGDKVRIVAPQRLKDAMRNAIEVCQQQHSHV